MKIEPTFDWPLERTDQPSTSRALVPVTPHRPPIPIAEAFESAVPGTDPLRQRVGSVDARNLSPRQIADVSMDLYVGGALSWEEYAMLAFQPELHPDYDRTIGALTGEPAAPDRPRDFVAQWETRLAFERKHNPDKPDLVSRTQRIVDVLRYLNDATNVTA